MRKLVLLMHVSLDGMTAGPNGEINWVQHDDEIFSYVSSHVDQVDTAMYGRVTYQMMERYWPTVPKNPSSTKQSLHHAEWVEKVQKVVISKSLEKVTWNNSVLIKDNILQEVTKLKEQPGKNIMIFGSPSVSYLMTQLGLIDEFLINVNPIILGKGIPLFKDIQDKTLLQLLSAKTFACGVVALRYMKKGNGESK